jgi:hypothetical protein
MQGLSYKSDVLARSRRGREGTAVAALLQSHIWEVEKENTHVKAVKESAGDKRMREQKVIIFYIFILKLY